MQKNGTGRREAAGAEAHGQHITHAKPGTQKTGEAPSGTGDGTLVWQGLSKNTALHGDPLCEAAPCAPAFQICARRRALGEPRGTSDFCPNHVTMGLSLSFPVE